MEEYQKDYCLQAAAPQDVRGTISHSLESRRSACCLRVEASSASEELTHQQEYYQSTRWTPDSDTRDPSAKTHIRWNLAAQLVASELKHRQLLKS